jgi:pyruvate,orthophosphate dikinase
VSVTDRLGATAAKTKYVYGFAEGSKEMRNLLGGKGANIAEMSRIGDPVRVPGGFTITTEACIAYMESGTWPDGLEQQVADAVAQLEDEVGKALGDPDDPLLVSVRSGARESMPGMLNTVLNLGLNDRSVDGLARKTDNDRFAWDSYRRFVQMFGNVVRHIDGEIYEKAIKDKKKERGVELDTELEANDLKELTEGFRRIFSDETGEQFPQDPHDQLRQAIDAVFDSWNGERAVHYRRQNRIPDDWGTAVNVQQMVFGNKGESSGSGVAFSRDEITGAPQPSGDFLLNAQGEDVVSGARNARPLAELKRSMPEIHSQLLRILDLLDHLYNDMQDIEFTIEEGKLYILQTRRAKRPAQAAVRVAVDMFEAGRWASKEEALGHIDAGRLEELLHPTFDPSDDYEAVAKGVAASPGAAKGAIVFTADDAITRAADDEEVILVRPRTEADDVAGFHAARGILTSEGGKASHAALVARGMGRPCVAGASELEIDVDQRIVSVNGVVLKEGDRIAINGTTGEVTTDDVRLIEPEMSEAFQTILDWADELREIGVRTNADTPADARKARRLGAEGIGLCRTEHMFMEADRQPKMKAMIMASGDEERRAALDELLPLQRMDFEGLFEAMEGLPVTIRLLDPPLHEFLPDRAELLVEIERRLHHDPRDPELKQLEAQLAKVRQLEETNPMLGTRGCRLGILYPDIYRMQVRAIVGAALAVRGRTGTSPALEIMIPLVDYERELELLREVVVETAAKVFEESGDEPLDFAIGTMIELPRACLLADEIAAHADFFSFGTNDLTQTALGFSRDDIEARILARYIETKILDRSPFETIDVPGVGALIRMAVEKTRAAKPDVKLGICGEHGGDPDSVRFFFEVGLDYVSCSPYRVPIARVAAAQSVGAPMEATTPRPSGAPLAERKSEL